MKIRAWILGLLLLLALALNGCKPEAGSESNVDRAERTNQLDTVYNAINQADTNRNAARQISARLALITPEEIAQARALLLRWFGNDSILIDSNTINYFTEERTFTLRNKRHNSARIRLYDTMLDSLESFKMNYLQLYSQRIGRVPTTRVLFPANKSTPGLAAVRMTQRGFEVNDTLWVNLEENTQHSQSCSTDLFINNRLVSRLPFCLEDVKACVFRIGEDAIFVAKYRPIYMAGMSQLYHKLLVLNLNAENYFDADFHISEIRLPVLHTNDVNFLRTHSWEFSDGQWLDIDNDGISELIDISESPSHNTWNNGVVNQNRIALLRIRAYRITPQGFRPATDARGRQFWLDVMPHITFSPTRAVWHQDSLVVLGGFWPGLAN